MMNNFDFVIGKQIEDEVKKQLAEAKPKEIIKETTIIRENLEDSLKCYTVKETSKFLGINEQDVRKLIKFGELKAIKFRSLKIPAIELNRFLESSIGKDFTKILGREF